METERDEVASSELLKRLRNAINNQPDLVPPEWKTAVQYAKEWNVTPNAASIILRRGLDVGMMECRKFRIQTGGRGNYPTQHYREVKKK